jgi:signal transduction histidine kinase
MSYLLEEIPKAIAQSLVGVERIAKIVGAMKDFSHPGVDRTPVDLNRAIASTITVASNEWKYVADIKTEFDAGIPFVPVMPGRFNQVILNMIVNAAQAIGETATEASPSKGLITVTTRLAGDWVEVDIADTGCGMAQDIAARVFDQFFTTKPVGKGTGQGLAIAHDIIVNKHGGTIAVSSEPGVGTTFTLRLPLEVTHTDR